MLPGSVPIIGGRGIELTYISTFTTGSDSSSYNCGTVDFGVSPCLAIVVPHCSGGGTTTVTVGGVSAPNIVTIGGSSIATLEITGGSKAIVVASSGASRASVHFYALRYYQNPAPFATDSEQPTNVSANNFTLAIPAGGVAIFFSRHNNSNDTSYNHAIVDNQGDIESDTWAAATLVVALAEAAHAEQATWTSSSSNTDALAASWR